MSFFKAPAWAKPQAKGDSDDEDTARDLFSHSKDFMAIQRDRLEQERRKKERAKQKEEEREYKRKERAEKHESKAGTKRESPGADSKNERVKKRRISSEESAKLLASVGVKPIRIDTDDDDEQMRSEGDESVPVRRSPRTQHANDVLAGWRTKSGIGSTTRPGYDSETESDVGFAKAITKTVSATVLEEEYDSDPEIAALQRRAHEKHRLKKQQQEQKLTTPGAANPEVDICSGLPTPPPPDLIISLFISSNIPATNEMLIKRKLNQDLGAVRRAWCQKQGFDSDFSDQVFFTWNGRRMYDVTTCQRLGLEVDAAGNIVRADQRSADGAAQVHVIATTQELLDLEKLEKVKQAKLESGEYEPEEETAPIGDQAPEKATVKIIIRAKDQKPVQLQVFSTTKISKIINYAKKQMGISADQPAYLSFDGDRLESDDVVGNTEMEDMENVDLILGD